MDIESLPNWLDFGPMWTPYVLGGLAIVLSFVTFLVARFIVARGLFWLSSRTENKYDDIIVKSLRPFRFAWIAPLLIIYFLARLLPDTADIIRQVALFLIMWLVIITLNRLLNAVNIIYEASPLYKGEPIQGYLDLLKILILAGGLILTVSLFTGQPPVVLLGGLGAAMAVLLLIFHDTLLSFVASIRIQSNDLIMEGDWLEVPSYGADGTVLNMALHAVTIQNWDKSLTMIPTHRLLEAPFKNWRGMEESGARRIKRSIHVDVNSVRFCDEGMLERVKRIELIEPFVDTRLAELERWNREHNATADNPVEGRQLTNIGVFVAYVDAYLRTRDELHQEGMTLMARQLEPGPRGLPVEVVAFTKTTASAEYEAIQGDIFDHLLATLPEFGLRVFQEPTGLDFQLVAQR